MKTELHSDRALRAAFEAMQPCHERTAVVVLAVALSKEAKRLLGPEKAAELAYQIADFLAADVKTGQ